MRRTRTVAVMLSVAMFAGAPALGRDKLKAFTLLKAVPADSWLHIHGVHNRERAFLDKHWARVFEALENTSLAQDIKGLLMSRMDTEEQQADFNQKWERVVELFGKVQWLDMVSQEFVYFQRINPLPTQTVLARPQVETLDANVEGLVALLQECAKLAGTPLSTAEHKGAQLWSLPLGTGPWSVNLFRRGPVVGLSSSRQGCHDVIDLLTGSATTGALANAPRFKAALADLPMPEDGLAFVDMQAMWTGFRQMMAGMESAGAQTQPAAGKAKSLAERVFAELDFIDYIALTEETDDLKTIQHTTTRLLKGARSKRLCRVLVDPSPIGDYLQHVPKDATGYWAWAGADFEGLHAFVKEFVTQNFDEGPQWIARWEEWQQRNAFNLQRDVLNWIEGPMIGVTFPPALQTGMGGSDWALLLKVRNGEEALAAMNKQVDRFSDKLMIAPAADVNSADFRSVTHPMLAMMGQLTYGVRGKWLYLSNSRKAINQCLSTADGSTPSFLKNARFIKEGIVAEGDVVFASFADTSTKAQEMAMALGMGMPVAAAMIPPTPDNEILRRLVMMAGKLAPVVAKMDFQRSNSSVCTYRNDRWTTKTVVTYKPYEAPAEKSGEQSPGDVKRELEGL